MLKPKPCTLNAEGQTLKAKPGVAPNGSTDRRENMLAQTLNLLAQTLNGTLNSILQLGHPTSGVARWIHGSPNSWTQNRTPYQLLDPESQTL